jgi:hypothetical protein
VSRLRYTLDGAHRRRVVPWCDRCRLDWREVTVPRWLFYAMPIAAFCWGVFVDRIA